MFMIKIPKISCIKYQKHSGDWNSKINLYYKKVTIKTKKVSFTENSDSKQSAAEMAFIKV